MLTAAAMPAIGVLAEAPEPVHSVAFSPDGTTLASRPPPTAVRLWDVATGRRIGGPLTGGPRAVAVAFSPDGNTLAGGSGDGSVGCGTWRRTSSGPPTPAARAQLPPWRSARTGRSWPWAATASCGCGTWPAAGRGRPAHRAFRRGHRWRSARTARPGRWRRRRHRRLWDVTSHQPRGARSASAQAGSIQWRSAPGQHPGRGRQGRVRAAVGRDQPPPGGRPAHRASGAVISVAFSRDGATVAAGGADGTARLWDVATHEPVGGPLLARPLQSRQWRSAQTERSSPPAAATARTGCGT